jgi:hypothetical protein
MAAFFCKAKKELPLVAFFYQQKIVAISKSFSLISGLFKNKFKNLKPETKLNLKQKTKTN